MTSRKPKADMVEETLVISHFTYAEHDIHQLNQNLQYQVDVLRMRMKRVEEEHEQEKKTISLQYKKTLSSKENEIQEKEKQLDSKDKQISVSLNKIQHLKKFIRDLEKMKSHFQGKIETEKLSKEQLKLEKLHADKLRSDLTQYESGLKDAESMIEQHKKKIIKLESEKNDMYEQMKRLTLDHKHEIKTINNQHENDMKKIMKDHEEEMKHQHEEGMAAMKNLQDQSLEMIKNAMSQQSANVVQIKMHTAGQMKQSEKEKKFPHIQQNTGGKAPR